MTRLTDFAITRRWAPADPAAIQLYTFRTPNGQKGSIALEELGLPYEAHSIHIGRDDQFTPEFLEISPNNKIPAMIDPDGPGGDAMALFESGAMLIYLAEKTGRLLPDDPSARYDAIQWLMFQMGGVGPMFGQMGWFLGPKGREIEDPRPLERYVNESRRLMGVLERRLEGRDWVCGDYSIADISIAPWLRTVRDFYKAGDRVGWDAFPRVAAYLDRFLARPAVQRGLEVPVVPE
ncbi:glutathione S-transferase [Rhodobacteraceae bacterium WD3A24]|nr:glutathione S-transferase [Rhodobacteraceae bacterium WD3A24]